jgi:hypothetical protein
MYGGCAHGLLIAPHCAPLHTDRVAASRTSVLISTLLTAYDVTPHTHPQVWADNGEIFGQSGKLGAYAQYAISDEKQVGLKPNSLSWVEAAALPLVGLTSLQAFQKTGAPWQASNRNLNPTPTPNPKHTPNSNHINRSLWNVHGVQIGTYVCTRGVQLGFICCCSGFRPDHTVTSSE